jgi:hypothetical protein
VVQIPEQDPSVNRGLALCKHMKHEYCGYQEGRKGTNFASLFIGIVSRLFRTQFVPVSTHAADHDCGRDFCRALEHPFAFRWSLLFVA